MGEVSIVPILFGVLGPSGKSLTLGKAVWVAIEPHASPQRQQCYIGWQLRHVPDLISSRECRQILEVWGRYMSIVEDTSSYQAQ